MTDTECPDLAGLNSEITLVPIAELMPFHDAGLRVKRLKEPSSSAELVLVYFVKHNFSKDPKRLDLAGILTLEQKNSEIREN